MFGGDGDGGGLKSKEFFATAKSRRRAASFATDEQRARRLDEERRVLRGRREHGRRERGERSELSVERALVEGGGARQPVRSVTHQVSFRSPAIPSSRRRVRSVSFTLR